MSPGYLIAAVTLGTVAGVLIAGSHPSKCLAPAYDFNQLRFEAEQSASSLRRLDRPPMSLDSPDPIVDSFKDRWWKE